MTEDLPGSPVGEGFTFQWRAWGFLIPGQKAKIPHASAKIPKHLKQNQKPVKQYSKKFLKRFYKNKYIKIKNINLKKKKRKITNPLSPNSVSQKNYRPSQDWNQGVRGCAPSETLGANPSLFIPLWASVWTLQILPPFHPSHSSPYHCFCTYFYI